MNPIHNLCFNFAAWKLRWTDCSKLFHVDNVWACWTGVIIFAFFRGAEASAERESRTRLPPCVTRALTSVLCKTLTAFLRFLDRLMKLLRGTYGNDAVTKTTKGGQIAVRLDGQTAVVNIDTLVSGLVEAFFILCYGYCFGCHQWATWMVSSKLTLFVWQFLVSDKPVHQD